MVALAAHVLHSHRHRHAHAPHVRVEAARKDDTPENPARAQITWGRRRINGLTAETLLRIARIYRDGGEELAAQIRRIIDQYGGEDLWPLAAPIGAQLRAWRLQAILDQADKAIQAMSGAAQDETLRATMAAYRQSYWTNAWTVDHALPEGTSVIAPVVPYEAVRAAVTYPYEGLDFFQRFAEQRGAFVDRIRRSMALSQLEGETVSQATSRVLRELGVPVGGDVSVRDRRAAGARALQIPLRGRGLTPRKHAELIARTELIRSSAAGSLAVYEQNTDVVAAVEWTATLDTRTDQLCIDLDSTTWALDDPAKRTPPAHPRCRCALLPVTKTWAELGLDLPGVASKPRLTYRKWAEQRGVSEDQDGGLRTQAARMLERE